MGNVFASIAPYSIASQQWPPASTFEPERDIPDLTGKVIIITGANAGIGYETTKELLRKNAKVYLACRDIWKAKEAVRSLICELKKEASESSNKICPGPGKAFVLELDLSDLASVKRAATEILDKEKRIDILINNAGVMLVPFESLTKQNYDLRTNVLGHYYFTILLLPALQESTNHGTEKARVINVSSSIHAAAPHKTGFDWQVLKGGEERDKAINKLGFFNDWVLYGVSKMGNVLMSNFLSRHYGDKFVSCSLHPGHLKSSLFRHASGVEQVISILGILHPVYLGAYSTLFAATAVPADDINGKFFQPWARFGRADPRASNIELQDQLKEWLEKEVEEFESKLKSD